MRFSRAYSVWVRSVRAQRLSSVWSRRSRVALSVVGLGLIAVFVGPLIGRIGSAAPVVVTFQDGVSGYSGGSDTFIEDDSPNTNFATNIDVKVDINDGGTDPTNQALLKFTGIFGSGAGQIPFGATITSATLDINVNNSSPDAVHLHQMIGSWVPTDTWNSMGGGIDRDDVEASSTIDVVFNNTGSTGAVTISGLESTVQAWSDGASNEGWAFFGTGDDGWDFDSSDYATVSARPKLTITYASNSAPNADASGPYTIVEGGTLNLDGSASSDPDGDPLSYAWDLDNDGAYDDASGALPSIPWSTLAGLGIDSAGVFDMGLEVSDGSGGGPPVFESVTTAENDGSTIVVAKPAGTVDGDLLIGTVGGEGGGATLGAPAGWTELFHIPSPGSYVVAAWYRIANSEPSSFTFTSDWPHAMNAGVARYSNVDPTSPINASATATGIGQPVAPDVTTTIDNTMVLRLGALEDATVAQIDYPAGHTGRAEFDSNSSPGQVTALADVVQASAGSTGAATFTSVNDDYVAATIVIAPATGGGGGSDTDAFTMTVTAGLQVDKVSSAGGSVQPGDRITYDITVANPDSQTYTGIAVTDPLPPGTTYVAGSTWVTYPSGSTDNVRDDFNATSYSGSTGSLPWTGAWTEIGENDGPSTGQLRVSFGDLNLFDGGYGIVRRVDLSAFSSADLTYRVGTNGLGDGTMLVEASPDSSNWTTLDTVTAATGVFTHTLDMDAFTGGDAYLRYSIAPAPIVYQINIDYVDITGITGGGSATDPGGAPPALASGYTLDPGESLTVTFEVDVQQPPGVASIDNTVSVDSDQMPGTAQDSTSDLISNVPPVFNQDLGNQSDAEGAVISLPSPATDPNADTLTYSATGLPLGLTIDTSTGLISGTIDYSASAGSPYAIEVRAEDPGALYDTDTFTWTVANTNRGPLVDDPGPQSNAEGDVVSLLATATDPDGDGFTWSAPGLPPGLTIDQFSGLISGTIDYSAAAGSPYTTVLTATDDGTPGAVGTTVVNWTVTDSNQPPVVTNPGDRANAENDPVTFAVVGSDPDFDTLTWTASGLPNGLSIAPTTGIISGTLTYTSAGIHPVTVRATDDGTPNLFDEVAFTWDVTNTNRAPAVVNPGNQSDAEGKVVSLAVGGSDPDLDTLTWTASGLPGDLSIDPSAGVISGTIAYSEAGSHPVTVRATDTGSPNLFDEVAFTWNVTDTIPPTGALLAADSGGGAGGDDLLTQIDITDPNPATNESPVGSGLGTTSIRGLANQPGTGVLFGATIDRLGAVDLGTGVFTAVAGTFGSGTGSEGAIGFDNVEGISFQYATGHLYGVHRRGGDDVIFRIDPTTGSVMPGVFGGDDYLVVIPSQTTYDDIFDIAFDPTTGVLYGILWDGNSHYKLAPIDLTTGVATTPGEKLDAATPHGLVFDSGGGGWVVGSPGVGGVYAAVDKSSSALGATYPLDDADNYEAIAFPTPNAAPVFDQNLGNRSDAEGDAVSFGAPATDPEAAPLTYSATGLPPGISIDPNSGLVSGTIGYSASAGSPFAVELRVEDPLGLPDTDTFTWSVLDTNRQPIVVNPGNQSDAEGDVISLPISGYDPDVDTLTWTATGLPGGLAIDPATGTISGTLGFSAAFTNTVTVRATDDGSPMLFTEVSFTWTITDTNRAPVVLSPGDQVSSEGWAIVLPISGSDPDLDTLTWSTTGLPAGLSIASATGTISGTLSYTAAGIYPVTVRATDDGAPNLFDEVAFTWTVTDVNRTPIVANSGDQAGAEGDAVTFAVSGSDPDGDGLTWTAVGLPGGLSVDAVSGVISGTLGYTSSGSHSVVVRATDDGSPVLFDEVGFSWDVADTNRPPVVVSPGNQSDAEADVVSLPVSGYDPDSDGLVWSASGLPAGLSIDAGSGTISGTLSYVSAGSYAVTVRATDDGVPVLFSEVAFSWSVPDTNRAPVVAYPGAQSDAEGDVVSVAVSGSDPDGDGLTWSATGLPGGLSIDAGSGVISGTLSYTSSGSHAVVVRATDDGSPNLFDETTFTWTVANTNRAPVVVNPGAQSHSENAVVSLAVTGSDPDGNTLTWSASGLPGGLVINPGSGVISGTLSYSSAGSHAVTVRATDNGSPVLWREVAFAWSVANTNRTPLVTSPGNRTNAEGASINLAVAGSDPDGNGLTWSATGLPGGLAIDPTSGVISGTVSFTAAGTHAVTVRATDNDSSPLFSEVGFTWTITNTNRAPVVINPGPQTTNEGSTVTLAITASDPDGNDIGYVASGLPAGLSIDSASGLIGGTLGYSLAPSYPVVIQVIDNGTPPASSQISFTWTIGEVNRAPVVAALADRTTEQAAAVTISPSASDPDAADTLRWSATGLPPGVAINAASGVISGAATSSGSFTVTVTATDNGTPPLAGATNFSWTVTSPPGFPVIGAIGNQESLVGDAVSLQPTGTHPDALSIIWSAAGLPPGLSISGANGLIRGTATTAGSYSVTVAATDTRAQQVEATFEWLITDPDLAPVTTDDVVRVQIDRIGSGVAIDVIGNDTDPEGAVLSLVSVQQPDTGVAEIVDGTVIYTPPTDWLGTVTFTYIVADTSGNQATGTITITVEESLSTLLAAAALQWDPATPAIDLDDISLDAGVGTELVLGSVFQSLYTLRLPLALLSGAVFWSLLLGGILNLGFVLKGGIPRIVRRTSRNVAVVMVAHGDKLQALNQPGTGKPIWRFLATDRGLEATGRRADGPGGEWAEIATPNGHGWVPARNLTEEIDKAGFAEDPAPITLINELVTRMRARHDITDLVSSHGIAVAHHGPIEHYQPNQLADLMTNTTPRTWKGRNPAYPNFRGSFDLAVATSFLDAWDHPNRELTHDTPTVPSTHIPVEFTNYHTISVGADVHGAERLDQHAWMIVFTHEGGRPRITGLIKEG